MSLADAFDGIENSYHGPECSLWKLLGKLEDDDAAALRAALARPDLAGSTIGKVLRSQGHRIGDDTVRRHRKGECRCGALGRV